MKNCILPPARQAQITAAPHARLRRQRLIEHLHRLGPKPLFHFIDEIERGADISEHLEAYARIDPDFVSRFAGNHFVEFLHVIDGGLE